MGLPAIKKPVKRPLRFEHIVIAQYFHAGTPLGDVNRLHPLQGRKGSAMGVFFNGNNPKTMMDVSAVTTKDHPV